NNIDMGKRIQLLRGGATQAEFAKTLGIKQNYISRYEQGRIPKAGILFKIALYGGVSIEWILTGQSTIQDKRNKAHYNGAGGIIEKMIIKELSKLEESDKKILLKVISKIAG
ncbi:MAG TPA: helix-turn-helix transcriptional regulator, partial [bacterium]